MNVRKGMRRVGTVAHVKVDELREGIARLEVYNGIMADASRRPEQYVNDFVVEGGGE